MTVQVSRSAATSPTRPDRVAFMTPPKLTKLTKAIGAPKIPRTINGRHTGRLTRPRHNRPASRVGKSTAQMQQNKARRANGSGVNRMPQPSQVV